MKTVRKIPEKYIKNERFGTFRNPEAQPEGGYQGPRRPGGAAPPRPRRGAAWAPLMPSDATLWRIFKARLKTLGTGTRFHDRISVSPPPRFQDRERQENSSWHPAGGEDHHRDLLHHHGRLLDDA